MYYTGYYTVYNTVYYTACTIQILYTEYCTVYYVIKCCVNRVVCDSYGIKWHNNKQNNLLTKFYKFISVVNYTGCGLSNPRIRNAGSELNYRQIIVANWDEL